ncbi:MAG: ABC transporter ATP-binding protein [Xanthobacteraceae bacterium]|jgi:branched-chain amino acid transport system ATP-binding protein
MSESALKVDNVSKKFGGLTAISDVSLDVADGSLTALIGPNGAGKTTLFNLITNLFPATAGEMFFYGTPLNRLSPGDIARLGLIRTFQTARVFPGMTVLENVLVGGHNQVRRGAARQMLWLPSARREERALTGRADAFLDIVGLSQFRHAAATDLPMGAQKLLDVIRALMARPRMLLLDEPAAGLNDSETAELASLLRAVRDSGVTVMVVEHNMSLVMSVADRVMVLDAGSLVASGTPQEIRQNARVIEAYVGQAHMDQAHGDNDGARHA